MKKEPIGVKGPMKKSEVYSSGSNLFAHKPVLTRKDSRPIKGGGEMDSPEGATIISSNSVPTNSVKFDRLRSGPRILIGKFLGTK